MLIGGHLPVAPADSVAASAAGTTPAELDAARRMIDSIRAEPFGADGIRIVFTLQAGWDTG